MPNPNGWVNVAMTPDARKFLDGLIVALTVKHRRRFTISGAIVQAAEDLEDELSRESAGR
jgi:hypothetical protein